MFNTKGFKTVRPQMAQHKDGYIVGSYDKEHFFYKENEITAKIETELVLSGLTPIYFETLKSHNVDGKEVILTNEEKEVIIERIKAGLECLGIQCEIFYTNEVDSNNP